MLRARFRIAGWSPIPDQVCLEQQVEILLADGHLRLQRQRKNRTMAKKTFEQSMKQLEQIVRELESGDLPLELAIKKFEEGMELSKFCSQKLEETERRITLLMQNSSGGRRRKTLRVDGR